MNKEKEEKNKDATVIDAENATVGRLASYTAKQALNGKRIVIINCESAVMTGRRKEIEARYLELRRKGGSAIKGPFFHTQPERIMKRIIRGMIPYKKMRGREALKRIICYNKTPKEFEEMKKIKSGKGKASKNTTTLKELSLSLKSIGKKE